MATRPTRKTTKPPDRSKVYARVKKKITPASDLPQFIRMLIYARVGQGKTRLGASAPKVLTIDVNDQGQDSVRNDYNPDVYSVDLWTELQDVFWYLEAGDHDYESVCIDNVTAMQTLCMNFVLGDARSRDASRDPDMPTRQLWQKVGQLMKTQITNYRNLPMHVVFIANQRSRDAGAEEDEGEIVVSPNCSPTVADHLERSVALIGHLTMREVAQKIEGTKKRKRVRTTRLLVGPSERYITKERYGVFPRIIRNPDLTEMIERIYGSKEATGGKDE